MEQRLKKLTGILLLVSAFIPTLLSGQELSSAGAELSIFRHGSELEVPPDKRAPIITQLVTLFNTCSFNTSQQWLRDVWEKDGKTIADIWHELRSSSYFSVTYPETHDIREFIVSINEEKYSLGAVMSASRSGEIVGYIKCNGHDHLTLFCMSEVRPYLPRHFLEYEYYESNCRFAR